MRSFTYFLRILPILFLVSCSLGSESSKSILIKGSDSSISNEYIYLTKSCYSQTWRSFYKAIDSCQTDNTGHFSFNIYAENPQFYQLRRNNGLELYSGNDIFLQPGDSIEFNKQESKIILNGSAAKLNQIQWDLPNLALNDSFLMKNSQGRNYLKLQPGDFIIYEEKLKQVKLQTVKNLSDCIVLPNDYENYIQTKTHCQWVNDYWEYMEYHKYYATGEWGYFPIDSIDPTFLNVWNPDTTFHFIRNYKSCIQGYVNHLYQEETNDLPDSSKWKTEFTDKYSIIVKNLHGINRDIAFVGLVDNFWYYLMGSIEDFYNQAAIVSSFFEKNYQEDIYYSYFRDQYEDYIQISPGQTAPDFTLPDPSNNLISLSDFKGKVVYIDFWGTWCYPCIQVIPKHLELQERLKDRSDVVFLFIALEYDQEAIERWKKFLIDKDIPGTHVVADKQFLNEQLLPYMLRAAPTYVLIDKEGKIAKTRAAGPESVYKDILKLVGES